MALLQPKGSDGNTNVKRALSEQHGNKLLQNATVNQMDLAEKCFEIIPELAVADVKGLKDYGAKIFDY